MWREAAGWAVANSFSDAVGYGPSRGAPVLVKAIADYFHRQLGWNIGPENIVVGPGSQMFCFAAAALYAGEDDSGPRRVGLPAIPDYTGYQGICMHPGGTAGIGRHCTQCFRITLTVAEKDLREGISRLGEAIAEASSA